MSENRFSQLVKINPENAEALFDKCLVDAKRRRARAEALAKVFDAAE